MKNVNHILSIFAIIMCLVLAYYIQFTDTFTQGFSNNKKNILLFVLLAYAIFRSVRLVMAFRKK